MAEIKVVGKRTEKDYSYSSDPEVVCSIVVSDQELRIKISPDPKEDEGHHLTVIFPAMLGAVIANFVREQLIKAQNQAQAERIAKAEAGIS